MQSFEELKAEYLQIRPQQISIEKIHTLNTAFHNYIEDITPWREDMNFMLEWQEQYLTRSLRSLVRYCFYHENIKFISSSQGVMFFLLYGD